MTCAYSMAGSAQRQTAATKVEEETDERGPLSSEKGRDFSGHDT